MRVTTRALRFVSRPDPSLARRRRASSTFRGCRVSRPRLRLAVIDGGRRGDGSPRAVPARRRRRRRAPVRSFAASPSHARRSRATAASSISTPHDDNTRERRARPPRPRHEVREARPPSRVARRTTEVTRGAERRRRNLVRRRERVLRQPRERGVDAASRRSWAGRGAVAATAATPFPIPRGRTRARVVSPPTNPAGCAGASSPSRARRWRRRVIDAAEAGGRRGEVRIYFSTRRTRRRDATTLDVLIGRVWKIGGGDSLDEIGEGHASVPDASNRATSAPTSPGVTGRTFSHASQTPPSRSTRGGARPNARRNDARAPARRPRVRDSPMFREGWIPKPPASAAAVTGPTDLRLRRRGRPNPSTNPRCARRTAMSASFVRSVATAAAAAVAVTRPSRSARLASRSARPTRTSDSTGASRASANVMAPPRASASAAADANRAAAVSRACAPPRVAAAAAGSIAGSTGGGKNADANVAHDMPPRWYPRAPRTAHGGFLRRRDGKLRDTFETRRG